MTESDLGLYSPDITAFLKARDAKKRAKKEKKEADVNYAKAKADLEDLRANFNAAFESSVETEN